MKRWARLALASVVCAGFTPPVERGDAGWRVRERADAAPFAVDRGDAGPLASERGSLGLRVVEPADDGRRAAQRDAGQKGAARRDATERSAVAPVARVSVPVLLVPGWLDTGRELAALRIRLVSSGWPTTHVEAVTFDEPTGSNEDHARELADAIDALLEQSGADRVDIVAHSMGGLATRWYLLHEPDAPVRRVAFIATPHRGTLSAHFSWGGGREEMMPESVFLDSLNTSAPAPERVEAITVRTTVDTHIVPGESATLPGVVDHKLCCPTHAGLLHHEGVFEVVRQFLDSGPS